MNKKIVNFNFKEHLKKFNLVTSKSRELSIVESFNKKLNYQMIFSFNQLLRIFLKKQQLETRVLRQNRSSS